MMRWIYVLILILASLIAVSPVQALDVCSLVSRSEMAAAIGEAISPAKLDGPDLDQASGSQTWTCTYSLADGVLAVSDTDVETKGSGVFVCEPFPGAR